MNQLRLVLLILAVGLAGLFGWSQGDKPAALQIAALWPNFPPRAVAPPEDPGSVAGTRARLAAQFAAVPEYARYFAQLKRAFPAEYDRISDQLAQKVVDGGAGFSSGYGVDRAFFQVARSLKQTHGVLAARAQNSEAQRVATAEGNIMVALSLREPALCVDFFYGGAEQGFFQFISRNRALAAEYASSWLDAIANGKQSDIKRPDPEDADIQVFDDALVAKGLTREQIEVLLDNKVSSPPLADNVLCQAAISYFQVLAGLPEEARMKLLARILALSAHS